MHVQYDNKNLIILLHVIFVQDLLKLLYKIYLS